MPTTNVDNAKQFRVICQSSDFACIGEHYAATESLGDLTELQ